MDIRSYTHQHSSEMEREHRGTPAKGGLWKLLVAAVLILLGLIAFVEIFGDQGSDIVAPNPPPPQADSE